MGRELIERIRFEVFYRWLAVLAFIAIWIERQDDK